MYFDLANSIHIDWNALANGDMSWKPKALENRPRVLFFVLVTKAFNIPSFGNYWMTSICMSMVSFLCTCEWVKQLIRLWPEYKRGIQWSFMLLPSFVFWTSGVLKESIGIGALLIFMVGLTRIVVFQDLNWKSWIYSIVGGYFAFKLKYYHLALTAPVWLAYLTALKFSSKLNISKIATFFSVYFFLLLLVPLLNWNLQPQQFLDSLFRNYQIISANSIPENLVVLERFDATWKGVFLSFPEAVFTGLFRPLIFEGGSVFKLYIGLENVFILIGVLIYVVRHKLIHVNALACGIFLITAAWILTISCPNLGSLSRYKIVFTPVLSGVALLGWNALYGRLQSHKVKDIN